MSLMVAEGYFCVPQTLVRTGILPRLSGSATKIYMAVMHEVERYSKREVTLTKAKIEQLSGVSPRTVKSAIDQLVAEKLIEAGLWGQEGFALHIVSPGTGERYDPDPRKILKVMKRASAPTVRQSTILRTDMAGTDFPFGANVQPQNGSPEYDFDFKKANM